MKRIIFYVGPNGCGKTRQLVISAKAGISKKRRSIAIANTPFVRFPQSRERFKVFRVNPTGIGKVVNTNLRSFFNTDESGSFDASDLLETIGFHPKIELEIQLSYHDDGYLDGIDASPFEIEAINSALDVLRSEGGKSRLDLSYSSDSFSRSLRERNGIMLKYIKLLKAVGIVSSYELVFYHKKRGSQYFKELSSGEQTLISTHLFIKTNHKKISTIFIDEPENSLHPEWQRRYIEMLQMALGYSEVKIVLATHSPVLVSGALSNYDKDVEVIKVDGGDLSIVDINDNNRPDSVEEILWEAFDTITPVSHFLSIELSRILQSLTDKKLSREEARSQIQEFQNQSYDRKQQELLEVVLEKLPRFG